MSTSRMSSELSPLEISLRGIAELMSRQDCWRLTISFSDLDLTLLLPSGTKQLTLSYQDGPPVLETSSALIASKIGEAISGKGSMDVRC